MSMSASTTCSSGRSDGGGSQLPTTTTFLPILDDLLSPDFRPVTHPPVITPLQTPTVPNCNGVGAHNINVSNAAAAAAASATVVGGGSGGGGLGGGSGDAGKVDTDEAAVKIQKWWKNSNCKQRSVDFSDLKEERVKHSVRHRRAEEHIRALESEVTRLKSSLATERKLRSLQYEAIRSLWSQVQKLAVNNPGVVELSQNASSIMSQSLPNGLPVVPPTPQQQPTQAAAPQPQNTTTTHQCNCATTMTSVVHKLEEEIAELRNLIMQSVVGKEEERSGLDSSSASSGSVKGNVTKRPDSLDLNGGSKGAGGVSAKPEEIQGYANEMAKFVVERGISDNLGEGGGDKGNK